MPAHGRWVVPPNRAYLFGVQGLRLLGDATAKRVLGIFGAANLVGAVVVYLYLVFAGQESQADVLEDLTWGPKLFAGYLVLSGVVGFVLGVRSLCALEWWVDGRPPTIDERLATLHLPRRFMALSLLAWTGGNVTFAVATSIVGDPSRPIWRSVVGAALGAATTATACSLVIDMVLRPVYAEVLKHGPMPRAALGVRQRIVAAWALGSGVPLLMIAAAPIDPGESVADLAVLGGIGIVAGGVMLSIATRSVSDRLASVRHALAEVRAGNLNVELPVDEAGEVGTLQAGVNAMVRGLRERQVLEDLFGRHVGSDVARLALEEGVHLGGEQRDVSVLFLDVTGSTWLAATRAPTEVVSMLNRLFAVVVQIVEEEGGWVDKFEGDAALCVFGAPAALADHPTHVLRAARKLREAVDIDFGIGISSGVVVAGNIGSEKRFEYTVIGDPVNEASRLTEEAKARDTRVLAACQTVERAARHERECWVAAATIPLRGRPEPTYTFEPRLSAGVVPARPERMRRAQTGE